MDPEFRVFIKSTQPAGKIDPLRFQVLIICPPEGNDDMEQKWIRKELQVEGMTSGISEASIEITLAGMDGVKDVQASCANARVCFSYDPEKTQPESVIHSLVSLGYHAADPQTARDVPVHSAPFPAKDGGALARMVLSIEGMSCINCEMRIEAALKKLKGVKEARVSYSSSTAAVRYDPRVTTPEQITEAIEKLDYRVKRSPGPKQRVGKGAPPEKGGAKSDDKMPVNQLIGIGIIFFAVYLIIQNTVGFNFIPAVSQNMGYGILFVVGLITSLHCVAMCGGINLSQCVSYKFAEGEAGKWVKLKPSLMYNAGRVVSYTVIGGIVGALGSVVSFSGTAKGIVAIVSGIFMVVMGLNMLDIFPWLRKFNPHMPKIFGRKIHGSAGKHGPFFVGLFNGLMPCGPLQAMQIYALGTGSFFAGAASMLAFSLGTVPLMFGFGAVSSFLSSKFTHKMMKVSAMLVMVLGVIMLNRGFSLSGIDSVGGLTANAASANASGAVAKIEGGAQTVTTQLQSGSYTPFVVQAGVPVKWTVRADAGSINGCNGTITIPKYNISKTLQPGDNVIEFTPQEAGNIPYTCWMGMIRSNITVVSDLTKVTQQDIQQRQTAGAAAGGCCAAA